MKIDRLFKNDKKVTSSQMEEWSKGGASRDSVLKSLIKNQGDLARQSLDLIAERSKLSSLSDKFQWLTKQDGWGARGMNVDCISRMPGLKQ
jgi:hypothetical protein